MGWTNPGILSSEQCLSTVSCRAHFPCTGHPLTPDISSSPFGVSSVTGCSDFSDFCRAEGHANLLDKAMKMPISTAFRLVVQQGKEQQSTDFLGTTCPTWTLECWASDSAGSYMSLLGLINAPWEHTTDGRGQWETGSQTGQHFRHLSQLGSVGRAFCWPLSPVSLACSAASRQENLRQQSSGVRAVPLLQYIDQSSLKESGLDIWDIYWLLHWLSSCPDPHSLSTAWITCTSMLGPVSLDLKGLHSQSFS